MLKANGLSNTPMYAVWNNMVQRCYNKKAVSYKYYGAKGIWVCYRWKKSFLRFYEDMGECPQGYTLERIDNNASYRPSNCKWATRLEQGRNRCTTKNTLYWQGEIMTLGELSRRTGISWYMLYTRIFRKGISPDKAVLSLLTH